MDSLDRRILKKWTTGINSGANFSVEERAERKTVYLHLTNGSAAATLTDLDVMIRMLHEARERLEGLGTLDGLEKIVP